MKCETKSDDSIKKDKPKKKLVKNLKHLSKLKNKVEVEQKIYHTLIVEEIVMQYLVLN
ncbi:hypothetical protein [Amedibacillus sp. YH-ame6]